MAKHLPAGSRWPTALMAWLAVSIAARGLLAQSALDDVPAHLQPVVVPATAEALTNYLHVVWQG